MCTVLQWFRRNQVKLLKGTTSEIEQNDVIMSKTGHDIEIIFPQKVDLDLPNSFPHDEYFIKTKNWHFPVFPIKYTHIKPIYANIVAKQCSYGLKAWNQASTQKNNGKVDPLYFFAYGMYVTDLLLTMWMTPCFGWILKLALIVNVLMYET